MEQLTFNIFKEPKAINFKCPFSQAEDRIKQAFSSLIEHYRSHTEPFYGKNLKYKLTGKDLEVEVDRFFSEYLGRDYVSTTGKNKAFDFKICNAPFSLKGFKSHFIKDRFPISISMNRSGSFIGLDAKKEMFNAKLEEAPYQMCVARTSLDGATYRFMMFIFQSSYLHISNKSNFISTLKDNKSKQSGYTLKLNNFTKIRLSLSASDQFSVDINDLKQFLTFSNAAILYKDFEL